MAIRTTLLLAFLAFLAIVIVDGSREAMTSFAGLGRNFAMARQWLQKHMHKASASDCGVCGAEIFCCATCSSLTSLLVVILSARRCCYTATFLTILATSYSVYSGLFSRWVNGSGISETCRLLCIWELFAIVVWVSVILVVRSESASNKGFFIPSLLAEIKQRWDQRLPYVAGPAKQCYDSAFFKKVCENAFDDVDSASQGEIGTDELIQAAMKIVHDPSFAKEWWLAKLLEPHHDERFRKHEAVQLLIYIAALRLEEAGCGDPLCYHFYMLQVTPQANKTEVETSYKQLTDDWQSQKQKEGSKDTSNKEFDFLLRSYEKVTEALHPAKVRSKDGSVPHLGSGQIGVQKFTTSPS